MSHKKWIVLTVFAVVVAVMAPMSAGAQTTADDGTGATDYLIVTLNGKSAAHQDAAKTNGRFDPESKGYAQALVRLERQHAKFAERLAKVAPDAEIVEDYFITANAVAILLNGSSRTAIAKISEVQKTQDSGLYTLDMNESVGLIKADGFWANNAGRSDAGAGVKVGIIDSGIDQTHPFFSCKDVEFGGVYASGRGVLPGVPSMSALLGPKYLPGPGDPLYFSDSHGTHVAGTVGGCITEIGVGNEPWDGTVLSGVAPAAELWDYNVFPFFGAGMVAFGGSAFSHDIAAAIEDAVEDGMDVINMSLGGGVQGPHDFLAEASNGAVEAGVVVVASAGNEGPGSYTVGSPGSASEVIAVGATTNTRGMAAFITIDPSDAADPVYRGVPGEFPSFDGTELDLIDWTGDDNTACSGAGASGLTGEVVLISRGGCTFELKVANAEAAGAGGVIIYNNTDGDPISMAGEGTIPAVMVTKADGLAMEALAPTTVSITAPEIELGLTPDEIADFSSEGPAPFTFIVKPDVMAPGVNILSSVMTSGFLGVESQGWELYAGTSMASPHVAGAAAALLGEHEWSPREVKSALVTTADDSKPDLSVFHQGGGLIDLVAADAADVFFYPSNASFGVMKGNRPANGSIDIAISEAGCSATADGSTHVSAEVYGDVLTVEFAGGRDAETDFYGGYVDVDCGSGGTYHLPWGAVVRR